MAFRRAGHGWQLNTLAFYRGKSKRAENRVAIEEPPGEKRGLLGASGGLGVEADATNSEEDSRLGPGEVHPPRGELDDRGHGVIDASETERRREVVPAAGREDTASGGRSSIGVRTSPFATALRVPSPPAATKTSYSLRFAFEAASRVCSADPGSASATSNPRPSSSRSSRAICARRLLVPELGFRRSRIRMAHCSATPRLNPVSATCYSLGLMSRRILAAFAALSYLWLCLSWFDHGLELAIARVPASVPLIALLASVGGLVFLRRPRLETDHSVAFGLAGVGLLTRLPFLWGAYGLFSSDAAAQGLMALHVVEGRHHPIFLYNWSYVGSIKAHLTALFTVLSGEPVLSFAFAAAFIYGAFVGAVYLLARTVCTRGESIVASGYVILSPGFLTAWGMGNEGNYVDVMLFGTLMLWLAARWMRDGGAGYGACFWIGLLGGLAFWTHILATYYLLTAVGVLGLCRFGRDTVGRLLALAAGFVVGDFPGILWNASHEWLSFRWWSLDAETAAAPDRVGRLFAQLGQVAATSLSVLSGYWPSDAPPWPAPFWRVALTLLVPVTFTYFAWRHRSKLRRIGPETMLLGFGVLVVLVFAQSSFGWMTDEPRYLLFLFSATPVFLGASVGALWRRMPSAAVLVLAALAFVDLRGDLRYLGAARDSDPVNREFVNRVDELRDPIRPVRLSSVVQVRVLEPRTSRMDVGAGPRANRVVPAVPRRGRNRARRRARPPELSVRAADWAQARREGHHLSPRRLALSGALRLQRAREPLRSTLTPSVELDDSEDELRSRGRATSNAPPVSIAMRSASRSAIRAIPAGGSSCGTECFIMAGECPDATPACELGDHSYFAYLDVDAVDGLYATLVERGSEIVKHPATEPWGMREFGIRTVDGHRIMFGEERGAPRGPDPTPTRRYNRRDVEAGRASGWYASGLRFTCHGCGHCCRGDHPGWVYVSPREVVAALPFPRARPASFSARFLTEDENGATVLELRPSGRLRVLGRRLHGLRGASAAVPYLSVLAGEPRVARGMGGPEVLLPRSRRRPALRLVGNPRRAEGPSHGRTRVRVSPEPRSRGPSAGTIIPRS